MSSFVCLCSSLLAVRYLEEKLNILGKIGCLLTVLGSVVIVIHAPSDNDIHSLNDFALRILSPGSSLRPPSLFSPPDELFPSSI